MKCVGIDSGTATMDIVGLDDETGAVWAALSVPRAEVTRDPAVIVRTVQAMAAQQGGLDAVVAPSGYGMPLRRATAATDRDLREATFVHREDAVRPLGINGLRHLMALFRDRPELPVWFTPGVIHLPTVPAYRKLGRVDMGTADKLHSVVRAMVDQMDRLAISPAQTAFIVVEAGYAYTAAIAVQDGQVVDGVGGTSGAPGFLGMGAVDAELAYALAAAMPRFSRTLVFDGGAARLVGLDLARPPAELLQVVVTHDHLLAMLAWYAARDVAALLPACPRPREVVVSGRFSRLPAFVELLRTLLAPWLAAPLVTLPREPAGVKEAAMGAAMMASGIAGGRYRPVVESLQLFHAAGSIFDHVLLGPDVAQRIEAMVSDVAD
ncbi:MAG: DUF1464 family protein [Firmicutes bacterium]|nr:DUF1464 family protein [Bacillota bacterium]